MKSNAEYTLTADDRLAAFEALPVKAHWDAIEKHQAELVKIYTDFAKHCLTGDIEKLKQEALRTQRENAVSMAQEIALGDAENLRWYLEMVTDVENETYETLPND